ncbi:hypothetical protein [Mechercharimyces sp. CAU 1602]|uniref:hypothetical protein n=1 Tax=Mechercharimyces sp. CAU 1602 TaxID=2973933 RepID=UPI00216248AC|nr:hypothetical protein [Mechercharimyces sp. CAU 1602]MCS1352443.1 hypothetical protein [Mechercharimyces sp. CAU 1602]
MIRDLICGIPTSLCCWYGSIQAHVKKVAREVTTMGEKEAEKVGKKSFADTDNYYLYDLEVKKDAGEVIVKADLRIDYVFLPSLGSFSYETEARAPLVQ